VATSRAAQLPWRPTCAVCARATGLSLQQLADRVGVAKTTLFKIESGRSNPTLETMIALGEFFSVSIADLLGGDATPAIEVVRAGTEGVDISGTAVRARWCAA